MSNYRREYSYTEFHHKVETAEEIPCRDIPEIFFPDEFPVGQLRTKAGQMAKDLCNECPIIKDCLLYAVTNKEAFGVWGGTLPNER